MLVLLPRILPLTILPRPRSVGEHEYDRRRRVARRWGELSRAVLWTDYEEHKQKKLPPMVSRFDRSVVGPAAPAVILRDMCVEVTVDNSLCGCRVCWRQTRQPWMGKGREGGGTKIAVADPDALGRGAYGISGFRTSTTFTNGAMYSS